MYEVDVYPTTGSIPLKLNALPDLPAAQATYSSVKAFATHSHNRPSMIDTWHCRLGHAGYGVIERMSKWNLVDGMSVTTYEQGPGSCEDCIMGKQTCCPFDNNEDREEHILDHVYINLWGPSHVQSNGGKSYMMQMVNSASAHTDVFFLADKRSETTLAAFKEYHVMAECQIGKKLHCIRTDEGSEFCNTLWAAYFAEHGIVHKTTAAYSSESNGVVEHSNQTVIKRTQVLLNDSGLLQSMWCEVAATVVYLKDFIPTTCHLDTTPYKDLRGLQPDVSHLRPFGCTAYAKIPVEIGGGKLDVRSVKCALISYFGRDSYRLLNRSTGRTYRSHDIVFEEGLGHHTLPPAPSSTNKGENEPDQVILEPFADNVPADVGLPPITETITSIPGAITLITEANLRTATHPQVLRCSTRNIQPTNAILRSQTSEAEVTCARKAGKDWAMDSTAPTGINSVQAFHTKTLPEPDNHWLPNSYDEAMTRPDLWGEPIEKEMKNMRDRNVWKVIENPLPDIRTIKTHWTFANKFDGEGKLTTRKARLVAKGFTQIPGVDFFESYASVVRYESLHMNLAITAANNMKAWQINYVATYLNSLPQAKVYIKLHDGSIAELLCSLYGLMDGAYNW